MDYTFLVVAAGCLFVGATAGVAGSFLLLRRQSLIGDAVAHCALPGIVIAFLITGERHLPSLLAGALATGLAGAWLVNFIDRNSRIDNDGALALVLSSFFGLGIVLMTHVQKIPNASQAGIQEFLFGQAATMLRSDAIVAFFLSVVVLLFSVLLWKEWKLVTFDPDFAHSLGWPVRLLDATVLVLLSLTIVIGLQAVGVVLMSAMIVAPAAAARQWTNQLVSMVMIAALIGLVSGLAGVSISNAATHLPTGPVVVLVAAVFVVGSVLGGRKRGLVWRWLQKRHHRRGVLADQLLMAFYQIAAQHDDPTEPRELGLISRQHLGHREYQDIVDVLVSRGQVLRNGKYQWALTPMGIEHAEKLAREY